jgi:transposase
MVVVKQSSEHEMWTEITRRKYEREGQRYASDLTDAEWALIEPHMPAAKGLGRPRETELRAVLDAILYIARTGCQWRMLPKDFPPFTTVQGYFYDWRDDGLLEKINLRCCCKHAKRRGASRARRGEQPGLNRGGCPLSLRIVAGETAGPDDYGAQLGDAAATSVVEVHKRKAGPGRRILQERDHRCRRQAKDEIRALSAYLLTEI